MSEETYRPGMGADIPEIGGEGFNLFSKSLKFGDIIENGWASENNPNKFGIVVKARGHSINCTDGAGSFLDLCFDFTTKIKIHGNVLNDNYELIIKKYEQARSKKTI
jgi:hypothetical protein